MHCPDCKNVSQRVYSPKLTWRISYIQENVCTKINTVVTSKAPGWPKMPLRRRCIGTDKKVKGRQRGINWAPLWPESSLKTWANKKQSGSSACTNGPWCHYPFWNILRSCLPIPAGPEPSPKPSTSPPSLGSPGRRPPKSPSEHKERKPSSSDDKKKVVCGL